MSFQEDCARFGDKLTALVDAGVPVMEAAGSLGISWSRCYAILRAVGSPQGKSYVRGAVAERDAAVVSVFAVTGSIRPATRKAKTVDSTARRVLVREGLLPAERLQKPGKPEARRRRSYTCQVWDQSGVGIV